MEKNKEVRMIVYDAQVCTTGTKINIETDKEYDVIKSCRGFSVGEVMREIETKIPSGNFLLPTDKNSMTRVYQFDSRWSNKRIRKDTRDVTWKFNDLLKTLKKKINNGKSKQL